MSLQDREHSRYVNWCNGSSKRTSNYNGEVFVTRKDRRINDRQFLKPRVRMRQINPFTNKLTRRAKSVRVDMGGYVEESKGMRSLFE